MNIKLDREIEAKYEVLAIMGEGGMGAVYKVRHRYLDEIQVIKLVREKFQADEHLKARFLREAKTAKKLRHPNIAEVIDYSVTSEGTAYIVMEFIEGVNLREVMLRAGQPLDPRFVVDVGLQALSALGYLHHKGFVHRDISPDNLMLTQRDGRNLIKLIDLGIAKSIEGTAKLTVDGKFVGKVQYASPEQFGGGEIDRRSDLYSLAVSLYELLTGAAPIGGSDYRAIIAGHLGRPPRSFEETDPKGLVPAPLRQVILKALQKDPDDRYSSAESFSAALAGTFQGEVQPYATIEQQPVSDRETQVWADAAVTLNLTPPPAAAITAGEGAPVAPVTDRDHFASFRRYRGLAALLALVAIAIVVVAVMVQPPPAEPPRPTGTKSGESVTVTGDQTGELIIKGLPWAEVVAVTDSSGQNRLSANPLYTPIALSLPPGSYKVLLSNPVSKRTATVTAEVKALSEVMCEAKLDDVDAASYLEKVLP